MSNKSPLLLVLFCLLIPLAATGCGASRQDFVVTSTSDTSAPISLSGRVFLGGAVPDADLSVLS